MMGLWIIPTLFISLALTLLFEEALGWLVGVRSRWDAVLIALVNLLTNPAVVFLYHINAIYLGWNQIPVVLILETAAILTEGACYRAAAKTINHPWIFSAALNLFSFTAGAVLTSFH